MRNNSQDFFRLSVFSLFTFLCNFNTQRSVSELTSYVWYIRFDTNFFFTSLYCSLQYFQYILGCRRRRRKKWNKKTLTVVWHMTATQFNINKLPDGVWNRRAVPLNDWFIFSPTNDTQYLSNILVGFLSNRADTKRKKL